MRRAAWIIELLLIILVLYLAEAGFLSLLSLTLARACVILGFIGLAFAMRILSPSLERLGNAPFWTGALSLFTISRVVWVASVPTVQVSDFHYYYQEACTIAQGYGINDPS